MHTDGSDRYAFSDTHDEYNWIFSIQGFTRYPLLWTLKNKEAESVRAKVSNLASGFTKLAQLTHLSPTMMLYICM